MQERKMVRMRMAGWEGCLSVCRQIVEVSVQAQT